VSLDVLFFFLVSLSNDQYARLQTYAAARVICLIPKFDHITPVLIPQPLKHDHKIEN
jgi:hypothetical protein